MPKRDSRPWLVHLLADHYAFAVREVYGDHRVYPEDFYFLFERYDTDELREAAKGVTSRARGRRKGWSKPIAQQQRDWEAETRLVRAVDHLRDRHSERSACNIVANKWEMDPDALRANYRRAKSRTSNRS